MRILSIVVTHNALQNNWIEKCLDSLKHSSQKTDIFIIDNLSIDETTKYIEENYPSIQLMKSDKNLGFGKANNIGLKKAIDENYDYVFLLNQDAWVNDTTLEKLIEVSSQNPEFGIISPIHLNGKGDALDFNFSYYISPQYCRLFYSDVFLNKIKQIYPVNFINAAAWLITKKCVEIVGGFSPTFYHYGEDDNYCHRVLWHQLKIGVTSCCSIYHDRENRIEHSTIKEKWNKLVRSFVLYYSNPFSEKRIVGLYLTLLKTAVKKPVFLKYLPKTIINLAYKPIVQNKEISKIKRPFIDE